MKSELNVDIHADTTEFDELIQKQRKDLEEIEKINKQTHRNNTIALLLSGVALGMALSRLISVIISIT